MMDVMVFCPVFRLEPETVDAIFALEHDGPITYLYQRDNPTPDGHHNILHQYQRGRAAFLAGSYDAMLVVESDIIPPPDALTRLAALQADVAYGVYRFRVSPIINVFERYPEPARNMGESLSLHPGKLRTAVKRGRVECSGGGLGCVLIRRPVLEAIEFTRRGPADCDTYFNEDVFRGGWSQWAAMDVICGHKNERGEILWPKLFF